MIPERPGATWLAIEAKYQQYEVTEQPLRKPLSLPGTSSTHVLIPLLNLIVLLTCFVGTA